MNFLSGFSTLTIFTNTFFFLVLILSPCFAEAQVKNPQEVKDLISKFKKDPRGPYMDIRWFCQDGSTRTARDPCPDKPGNQHARYKNEVVALAKKEHLFLGQILTNTPYSDFWDAPNANARIKQYQMEQYLRRKDNQWILRRAQYYRGAIQSEDEANWGIGFYHWLLADTLQLQQNYFLIRQGLMDIPHAADTRNAQLVRALSKEISDTLAAFQNIRIKIHGLPDAGDIKLVREFQQKHQSKIPEGYDTKVAQLLREMEILYRPFEVSDFNNQRKRLSKPVQALSRLDTFLVQYSGANLPGERCKRISGFALNLRRMLPATMKPDERLALLDISLRLESMLFQEINLWEVSELHEVLSQVYCLSEAAAAFGYLAWWEWAEIRPALEPPGEVDSITLKSLGELSDNARNIIDWGTSMMRTHYLPVEAFYKPFEPLAEGFLDDRIRSSILLPLGNAVTLLGDIFAQEAGLANLVMSIPGQSGMRGLNPGYALGELVVDPAKDELNNPSPDKIYVFHHPPDDLKPVAGIATVTEGNLVSHVQLLARNLGIPNMRLTDENLASLKTYHMQRVFYAVSPLGTVIMKPESEMTPEEVALFAKGQRQEKKIEVPTDKIILDNPTILNLRNLRASHSGIWCGPKAANLGQLKHMFPDHVVEGLVLPFSIFRAHMQQLIPGQERTYWQMMTATFEQGQQLISSGKTEAEAESFILAGLDSLRNQIKKMPFLPGFERELEQSFRETFGKSPGEIPVFIRSDTNMEDLKDFTGAGLNLTIFNALDAKKVLQGIRDVWASPYAERSYKWRQRYLLNPENVYPSILIIPSVNADCSGVLITKGITTGNEMENAIAFNRGVGGAVDGQAAESWILAADTSFKLVTPARELRYLTIPATGGSVRLPSNLESRILSPENLLALQHFATQIRSRLPTMPGIETNGPFDVELGFQDNKIWLFQVRPFVESKQAATSDYLLQITPKLDEERLVSLKLNIPR